MFETLQIIGPSNFHYFSIILTILLGASAVFAELGSAVKQVLPPAPYKFVLFDNLVFEQNELRNFHLSRECSRQKLFANFGQNGWSTNDAHDAAGNEQQQWHLKLSVLDDEKLLEKCLNGYYTVMTDHNGAFQMDVYKASRLNIHLIPLDKCGMPLKSEKVEGAAVQTLLTFNQMLFSVGVLGTVNYHQNSAECSAMAALLGDTDEASKFVLDSFDRLKTNGGGQLSTERVYFLAAYLRQIGAEITKYDREGRPKLFCLQSMELLRVFPQQLGNVNLKTIQNSQFFHGIFYELWTLCSLMTDELFKYKSTRNGNFEKIDLSRHINSLFMGWRSVCGEMGNLWPKKRPSVMLEEVLGRRMHWLDDLWKFGAVLKYLIWAMDGHGQTGKNGGQQKLDEEDKQTAIKIGNFLTESHRRQMAKTALKTAQIQKHVEQFCLAKDDTDEEIVRAWEKVCDWVSVELFKRWLNNEEELSLDSESKLKIEFKRLMVNENGSISEKNIKLLEEIGTELSISTKNQMKTLLWNKVPKIEGLKQLFQQFCAFAMFMFDQKFKSWRTFCLLMDFRDQLLISHDSYGTKGRPSKYSKHLENLIEEAENEGKKRMSPEDKELLDIFGALMAKMLEEHEEGREMVARNLIRLIRVNGFCSKKWAQFHAWDKLCFQLLKECVMEWINAQNDLQRSGEPLDHETASTSTTIIKAQIPLDQSTRLMMEHLRSLHQRVEMIKGYDILGPWDNRALTTIGILFDDQLKERRGGDCWLVNAVQSIEGLSDLINDFCTFMAEFAVDNDQWNTFCAILKVRHVNDNLLVRIYE